MKKKEKKGVIERYKELLSKQDKILLFCTILLVLWGLFNIVTASSRESVAHLDKGLYFFFDRHSKILIACFIISMVIITIPSSTYFLFSTIGYGAVICLIIFALINSAIRGSNNWLFDGSFQPSEFAKPIIIIFLSCLFEKYQKKLKNENDKNHNKLIIILASIAISIPALVFLQKDAGTAFIIATIVGSIYLFSPMIKKAKLKSLGLALILCSVAVIFLTFAQGGVFTGEQISRIKFVNNPCDNYENGGYQVCNGYIAFNQGGLWGLGIGKSQQKYSYIPEPHTDSVFAIMAEELGALLSGVIFIFYAILLYRILKIASQTNKTKNRLICIGVATYIFIHIFINLGGLLGLIPLTGIPLPFFTYGGSFTLSMLVALACVQRISIESKED